MKQVLAYICNNSRSGDFYDDWKGQDKKTSPRSARVTAITAMQS